MGRGQYMRHGFTQVRRHQRGTLVLLWRRGGDVTFSYQLLPGKATTRNAIRLLSIMGYQEDIIQKAEQMALEFVRNSHWQMLD